MFVRLGGCYAVTFGYPGWLHTVTLDWLHTRFRFTDARTFTHARLPAVTHTHGYVRLITHLRALDTRTVYVYVADVCCYGCHTRLRYGLVGYAITVELVAGWITLFTRWLRAATITHTLRYVADTLRLLRLYTFTFTHGLNFTLRLLRYTTFARFAVGLPDFQFTFVGYVYAARFG